jgi:hypothetical protein
VNTWTEVTTPGTLGVTPFVYAYNSPGVVYPSLRLAYGVNAHFDVATGLPFKWTLEPKASFTWDELSLLFRWFPSDGVGVVAGVSWLPGVGFSVGPQLHVAQYGEHLSYILNVGWSPVYDVARGTFRAGSAWLYGGPEWWFTKRVSVFCEVDPFVQWTPGARAAWSLAFVPGVGVGLDEAQKHYISVGLQLGLPWTGAGSVAVGAWYWTSFDVNVPADDAQGG